MANTYTLIASASAGSGGASSFDFTSIPNTYTDLFVDVSGRGATGYNASDTYVTFNGSATSYSGKYVMKDSTATPPVSSTSATTRFLLGFVPATQASSGSFGSMGIYIPNYAGSTNKSISVDSATENNGSIQWLYFATGLWSNTSAINQVTVFLNGDTFAQYSTAYLYGIKNS